MSLPGCCGCWWVSGVLRLGSARTGVEKIRRKRRKIKNDPTKKKLELFNGRPKNGFEKEKGGNREKEKSVCNCEC